MKSFGCFAKGRVYSFFFLIIVALLSWDGFGFGFVRSSTRSSGFCQAFILPNASSSVVLVRRTATNSNASRQQQHRELKRRSLFDTSTTVRCHDCCSNDDNEYECDCACEDCDEGIPARVSRHKKTKTKGLRRNNNHDDQINKLRTSHNPSRREFVAWNSIFAGIATGAALSVPGTSAKELIGNADTTATATAPAIADAISSSSSSNILSNADRAFIPYSSVRQYKSITLSNGMKVLLVSDKTARQSSAALTINGAGQFSDPTYLNGLAHLMEHIALSSKAGTSWRSNQGDFQEWLDGDYAEGFSNGFTAYEKVCFHFQCGTDVFGEALDRFSNLFLDKAIRETCQNKEAVKREIRRVNSELDKNDLFSRELYLTKSLINPKHPYAKMTLGSIESLETVPAEADINVSKELYEFFKEKYQPDQAVLVVVSSASLSSLESMVQPFSSTMSRQKKKEGSDKLQQQQQQRKQQQRVFPAFLLPGKPVNPICLFRGKVSNEILADNLEKISFQWALDQDYTGLKQPDPLGINNVVTATQIGFIMAEILGRRGPGSLFKLLKKRKWLPEGNRGVPRISFPVDVSGFQIMRLEIVLTLEGFAKRSSVTAAVYECLGCLRANPPSRELIAQYCSVAQLYGHVLAPRAPDAIELAFDGQIYGVDGLRGVGTPGWRLMPFSEDTAGVLNLQKTMQSVLTRISDPVNAITIVTASQRAIRSHRATDLEDSFPLFSPASWEISPTTQARYLPQNNVLTGKINEWLIARIMEEKLQAPVLNPLIPPALRPARLPPRLPNNMLVSSSSSSSSSENSQQTNLQVFAVASNSDAVPDSYDPDKSSLVRDYWALLKVYSHNEPAPQGMSLPRMPPEPSSRAVFVLQLLSSRPPRATAEMAAHAEIWRISLEYTLIDLAELGAPAGLAYEISYNKYGMRVAFLGLSQNIASYARRISRRMVDHTNQLLEGPEQISDQIVEASIRNTNRFRMSPKRKNVVTNILKQTTASDAAREGTGFFKSCSGAVCFSEGDMLPAESLSLLADLKGIFRKTTAINVRPAPAVPEVGDLMYRANWIPRAASVCTITGASLISNPCGRVPR